jgi:hypothetical protein
VFWFSLSIDLLLFIFWGVGRVVDLPGYGVAVAVWTGWERGDEID